MTPDPLDEVARPGSTFCTDTVTWALPVDEAKRIRDEAAGELALLRHILRACFNNGAASVDGGDLVLRPYRMPLGEAEAVGLLAAIERGRRGRAVR